MEGEALFEAFCEANQLHWQRVPEADQSTPDYRLVLNGETVYFEIKQINEDNAFRGRNGVSSRTVGNHVRRRMHDARKQIQQASAQGQAGVLLIYNNLDHMQLFGTETHDFLSAMYGEMTITIKAGKSDGSYYGRNSKLRENQNTSFSAVGHLTRTQQVPRVRIFENVFATNPLKFAAIPECIEVVRIEVEDAA